MRLSTLAFTLAAALPLPLASQTVAAQATHPYEGSLREAVVKPPAAVEWAAAPAILPPGAELSVLEGDPSKEGFFTMRLRMPHGYRIPPHYHLAVEHVTVLSGSFKVGMGATFDASQMVTLPAGSFGALPPHLKHYALADGETVIQLHGIGPWGLIYVNAADDPRRR